MSEVFNEEKYSSSLDVISYEEIFNLLADKENVSFIFITSKKDAEGTGKTYYRVEVISIPDNKSTYYLAPDHDPDVIHEKLNNLILYSSLDYQYSYLDNEWMYNYICTIGKNYVAFPSEVAKKVIKSLEDNSNRGRVRTSDTTPIVIEDKNLPFGFSDN